MPVLPQDRCTVLQVDPANLNRPSNCALIRNLTLRDREDVLGRAHSENNECNGHMEKNSGSEPLDSHIPLAFRCFVLFARNFYKNESEARNSNFLFLSDLHSLRRWKAFKPGIGLDIQNQPATRSLQGSTSPGSLINSGGRWTGIYFVLKPRHTSHRGREIGKSFTDFASHVMELSTIKDLYGHEYV
jgi:hypothetical protein